MKYLPNIITLSRIALCAAAFFVMDDTAFIVLYFAAGVSDVLDGWTARRLGAETASGARLDSAADLCLAALTVVYLATRTVVLDCSWIWWVAGAIVALRLFNLGFIRRRFGLWASTHTVLNKTTGAVLFAVVPVAWLTGNVPVWLAVVVSTVALLASAEECVMITSSKRFDPDRRSIFSDR